MAEIANSKDQAVARWAVAFEVTEESFRFDRSNLAIGSDYIKEFVKRFNVIYRSLADSEGADTHLKVLGD